MTKRRSLALLPAVALLLAVGVVVNPVVSLTAARQGIHLWWTTVLPGQLPFFILSDLLQATGVVKALGVLLDPFMRPLFALPGAAGFALAVGFTAGPPAGARAAARLTSAGFCSPEEGSRLAAFANVAGPLFVTGVTAVSLFRAPAAAPLLASVHYGAALLAGLLLARLPSARRSRTAFPASRRHGGHPFRLACEALEKSASAAPPVGQLLGIVVRQGGETALQVGGFIVLFSVVIGLAEESGLLRLLAQPLDWAAHLLGLPPGLMAAGLPGLLEVTVGLNRVAAAPGPLPARLTAASALLAWEGLSIHAQAAAISASAGLSYRRFLQGRLLHVVLGLLLCCALWPLMPVLASTKPVLALPQLKVEPLAALRWSGVRFIVSLTLLAVVGVAVSAVQVLRRHFCAIWLPLVRR
ncbi:MAG: nucleoside recognition domain-containing protein [Betaproteobacteria bacterium]